MYHIIYVLHNFIFACLTLCLTYGFYYLDINFIFYSIALGVAAFSILYVFSKNAPIKRRHSDYHEDDIVLDSNA